MNAVREPLPLQIRIVRISITIIIGQAGAPARMRITGSRLGLALLYGCAMSACGGGGGSTGGGGTAQAPPASDPPLSAAAQLGQKIFEDKALSVSGRQSCATCHVARYAFTADPTPSGPDGGLPVPLGGPNMDEPGFRNTPSLMYLSYTPAFFFDADGSPNGGFFRDGRAATLADQAMDPFTTPFEMANADAAAVIEKLKSRPYIGDFASHYGE